MRYFVAVVSVLQALRRRPQCNLACCMSVMMMMNDAAEDVVMYEEESDSGEQESEEVAAGNDPLADSKDTIETD